MAIIACRCVASARGGRLPKPAAGFGRVPYVLLAREPEIGAGMPKNFNPTQHSDNLIYDLMRDEATSFLRGSGPVADRAGIPPEPGLTTLDAEGGEPAAT